MTSCRTEIDDEQSYVTTLYRHLDGMRTYAQERLSKVLLESGGTPQARSERESFSRLYTDDLAKYDAAENGLCFGRLDVTDAEGDTEAVEKRYIGRVGILDEDDEFASLLLDWRAPMARPFYLATPAAPDGVRRRRHIRSRRRQVTALHDEYLDLDYRRSHRLGDASDDSTTVGGVAGEGALLEALNAARTGQMQDIVETIQAEQDRIIRSEHKSVMVVQGGPGTGKTAVALHRAAYLLYTHRSRLAKSGVLIVGPNDTFLDYIGQVLPSLGETGVLLSTIGNLYPGVLAERTDAREVSTLKGALSMVDVLRKAVRDRQTVPASPVELRFDTYRLRLDRKICTRARGRARSSRRPHNLARPLFASMVIDALAAQFADVIGSNLVDSGNLLDRSDLADIRADMRRDPEIEAAIDRFWPKLTPQQVLTDLLASPAALASAAPDLADTQRESLVRSGDGFSPADAPLLDELAELLGDDDSEDEERRRREWRRQIAEAQDALDILAGSAPQDLEDDLDPELLMAYDVIDADQLAQRQNAGSGLTTAERAAGDRTWTYGHIIVDEAQELSPMAWRMLMRRCPNRWMTIVGDTAQAGDPAGSTSWSATLEPYVAQRWQLRELSVNYRTPAEVMDIAAEVLAEIDPKQSPPRSIRASGRRPVARKVPADSLVDEISRAVSKAPDSGIRAIIGDRTTTTRLAALDSPTTRVLTIGDAKGLEFDEVLIVEPQDIVDESPRGWSDLYVALTRATQQLEIVHSRPLPAPLVRALDRE